MAKIEINPFGATLALINASHPFSGPLPPLAAIAQSGERMAVHAVNLLEACLNQIGANGRIVPVSGFRTHQQQSDLYRGAVRDHGSDFAKQYVAAPGCSEHESGLAIDLALNAPQIDFIRPHFPGDGICGQFRRCAHEYGFILRYPKEKEALTGIAYEPWHFRYVGVPHAQIIEEHGLCLEEYAAFLQAHPIRLDLNPKIHVCVEYIRTWAADLLSRKAERCTQISTDNCGGYILTTWEVRL